MSIFWNAISQRKLANCAVVFFVSTAADNLSALENLQNSGLYRVLIDSCCHQILGILTYFSYSTLVCLKHEYHRLKIGGVHVNFPSYLVNILLSQFFSFILDLDHFIAAKSFTLHDATHLSSRPFGHAIFFIFLVSFLIYCLEKIFLPRCNTQSDSSVDTEEPPHNGVSPSTIQSSPSLSSSGIITISTIYLLSSLTHVIRDSSRRGLWVIYSWQSPPIPYIVHLLMLGLLPYVIYSIHFVLGYQGVRNSK